MDSFFDITRWILLAFLQAIRFDSQQLVKLELMQVMLLGHSDSYVKDKAMQVTIAFNHFGEGLIQRMPR
jgi:hypothetical protein